MGEDADSPSSVFGAYCFLEPGPRFASHVCLPESARIHFPKAFSRGQLCRSSKNYPIVGKDGRAHRTFAYGLPGLAGCKVGWDYQGTHYLDLFVLKRDLAKDMPRSSPTVSPSRVTKPHLAQVSTSMHDLVTQKAVKAALKRRGALFSDEICVEAKRERIDLTLQATKTALWKMTKKGHVARFDEHHRGWRFAKGYLYSLPGQELDFARRLESLDDRVVTRQERLFLARVRGGLWLSSDLREITKLEPDSITYMARKFARSGPLRVKAEGTGYDYHIALLEDPAVLLEGKGLLPWLKTVNLFGQLVFYDERAISFPELRDFVVKAGYWLSEEGKRRQAVGEIWESYSKQFFDLCDKKGEWQLRVQEHRQNWKGRSGREFDHIYQCLLGPDELGLELYLVFECKAGIITSAHLDEFGRALANEQEFRNSQVGGIKNNILPVMVTGKTVENVALEKARRVGIRIVFHTTVEEVVARLTGNPRKTFYKVLQEQNLLPTRNREPTPTSIIHNTALGGNVDGLTTTPPVSSVTLSKQLTGTSGTESTPSLSGQQNGSKTR